MPARLGRYEIVRELGKGAMGIVYEGRDPKLNRRVAIKTARRDVMESSGLAEEMMERFLREAHSAGGLDHPNIIRLYDAGQEGDIAFIAMEYLEGGDLRDVLDGKRRMRPEEVAEIGATICEALHSAHEHGIVHRDIKPANIMTPRDRPIKLADFGIAHVVDSDLTQDGALVGTPHYMSPEQFMGQRLDGRSDLFSVGVMLYELLTGQKPFLGEALTTVMHQVLKTTPTEPCRLNPAVCESLSRVVMKSMSKKPQERYTTGLAMAAALRESIKPIPDPVIMGFAEAAAKSGSVGEELPGIDTLLDGLSAVKSDFADAPTLLPGATIPPPQVVNPDMEKTVDLPRKRLLAPAAAESARWKRWAMLLVPFILLLVAFGGWRFLGGGAAASGVTEVGVPVTAFVTESTAVIEGFDVLAESNERIAYIQQLPEGIVEPLQEGSVTAIDGDSGAVLSNVPFVAGGDGEYLLQIPATTRSVKYLVTGMARGKELREEVLVLHREDWEQRQVFLLRL